MVVIFSSSNPFIKLLKFLFFSLALGIMQCLNPSLAASFRRRSRALVMRISPVRPISPMMMVDSGMGMSRAAEIRAQAMARSAAVSLISMPPTMLR